MKLTMLGTGNALVTEVYNTCFLLEDETRENDGYFLVDAGGGNGILKQLKRAGTNWRDVHEIFITHKHIDHFLGALWLIRMILQKSAKGEYKGETNIYGHDEVISLLLLTSRALLNEKEIGQIGKTLHFIAVSDGESRTILGREVTFFDIRSTKAKQYGFCMRLKNGEKFTCCGDEPYNDYEEKYAKGSEWLMHEAFCLYSQADKFSPYEKHHSTVKDACALAELLGVKNLILYHTEDSAIQRRKEAYAEEGKAFYHGNLFIPDDLESVDIKEE